MQFRKTMKNKKRFRGGETEAETSIFAGVVNAIKTHSGNALLELENLCGETKCSEKFLSLATEPKLLAAAGISAAAYAAYLLYGTRKNKTRYFKK